MLGGSRDPQPGNLTRPSRNISLINVLIPLIHLMVWLLWPIFQIWPASQNNACRGSRFESIHITSQLPCAPRIQCLLCWLRSTMQCPSPNLNIAYTILSPCSKRTLQTQMLKHRQFLYVAMFWYPMAGPTLAAQWDEFLLLFSSCLSYSFAAKFHNRIGYDFFFYTSVDSRSLLLWIHLENKGLGMVSIFNRSTRTENKWNMRLAS